MNEELKIIITAAVQDAVSEMQKVNKELENIEKNSSKSSKGFGESMKTLAKGATVAITAITAVTTAMVALGNKSAAAQKEIGKLETAFQAMGSSAKQAQATYTGLYRFMDDAGAATEAAGHLAKITTNSQDLAEWTQILQGVYSTFGASLPIESLTEAANESLRVGKVTGALADALNWAGVSEDEFNAKLAQTTTLQERERLLRSTLNGLYMNASRLYEQNNAALLANAEAQARLDSALADAHTYLVPLLASLAQLATSLLTEFKPVLETVSAILVAFVQYLVAAIKWVGSFFSMFSGGSGSNAIDTTKTISTNISNVGSSAQNAVGSVGGLTNSLDGATKAAKELKRQTMGFDELNVLQPKSNASAGGAGAGGTAYVPSIGGGIGDISIPDVSGITKASGLTEFQEKVEGIKKHIEGLISLAAIFVAVWGSIYVFEWLYTGFMAVGNFWKHIQPIAGKLMIIVGILQTIYTWCDAWVNGLDWGNLLGLMAGLAVAITGVYMACGKWYGTVALLAAGIALVVLGVKDFIKNGPTVENTIAIITGALVAGCAAFAVALGVATAGVSAIIAAIVAAVTAITGFVVAIVMEEEAIKTTAQAQEDLTAAINATIEAENSYINAIDAAENARKRLDEAEKAAGVTGAELRKQVEEGTLTYGEMTDAQKECYKAYLDNEQKQKDLTTSTEEFEKAKKAEIIASYENQLALAKENGSYDEYKKSVIQAFNEGRISADEARDLIGKSMSEMSDDAQQTFMEDLPDSIKDGLDPSQYETTRKKMGDWFKKAFEAWKEFPKKFITWLVDAFKGAWEGIKKAFSAVGTFFTNVWDTIKNIFSSVGTSIANAISGAVKGAVNWILEKAIGTINGFLKAINFAIGVINAIPGVNIKKLTLLEVPKLATGGIVTRDTLAHIGEGGKREAVLPLDQNTEWMDILAERISQRSGAPSKLVLMVDGKELGWATINGINDITTQTGNLQLRLV